MGEHDHSYKQLFSHPRMVEDLLRGFVREAWVEQADFSTLEKVSGSYVTDDLRDREDDIIWRLRWGSEWLYVYLLLEFQSTVDRFMAVRMMVYLGLLYQDLIKGDRLSGGKRLPAVLPVVLYNGEPRWTAPEELADLIDRAPSGLERYRPRFRYLLLDEGRYREEELAPLRNLVAAVFRLEKSRTPADLEAILAALTEWLKEPEQHSLRRAFTVWLKRVLLPRRLPKTTFPDLNDLQEVRTMLAERVEEWTREWRQEGRQEGLLEGERLILTKLLESKFGPLSETHRRRLGKADPATLLAWSEHVLTANSIEEVLE